MTDMTETRAPGWSTDPAKIAAVMDATTRYLATSGGSPAAIAALDAMIAALDALRLPA